MSPQYGNHIGIIINSLDPEGRGRVQVFIPHLSTTLFNQWNVNAQDIKLDAQTFQEYVKQDNPIGKSLRENLPWAEAARPLLGSGGTTIVGRNGKTETAATSISPPSQQPENNKLAYKKPGAPSGKPVNAEAIFPLAATGESLKMKTGENDKGEPLVYYYNGKNYVKTPISQATAGTFNQPIKGAKTGTIIGTITYQKIAGPVITTDYNQTRDKMISLATSNWNSISTDLLGNNRDGGNNGIDTPEKYVDKVIIPIATAETVDNEKLGFQPAVPMIESSGYISYGFGGLTPAEPDGSSKGDISRWIDGGKANLFASYGVDKSMDTIEGVTNPDTGLQAMMATVQANLQKSPTQSIPDALDGGRTNGPGSFGTRTIDVLKGSLNGNSSTKNIGSNTNGKILDPKVRDASQVYTGPVRSGPLDKTTFGQGANYQLPQGSNSVPQPGNMVWVFFLNGDLQKPVYFASVTEAYANARNLPAPASPPAGEQKQLIQPTPVKPPANTTDDIRYGSGLV